MSDRDFFNGDEEESGPVSSDTESEDEEDLLRDRETGPDTW